MHQAGCSVPYPADSTIHMTTEPCDAGFRRARNGRGDLGRDPRGAHGQPLPGGVEHHRWVITNPDKIWEQNGAIIAPSLRGRKRAKNWRFTVSTTAQSVKDGRPASHCELA